MKETKTAAVSCIFCRNRVQHVEVRCRPAARLVRRVRIILFTCIRIIRRICIFFVIRLARCARAILIIRTDGRICIFPVIRCTGGGKMKKKRVLALLLALSLAVGMNDMTVLALFIRTLRLA